MVEFDREEEPEAPDVLREAAERIQESGAGVLSDRELIGILIGNAATADRLCQSVNVRRLHQVPEEELVAVRGIGSDRARRLIAAAELGRRLWPDGESTPLVRGPESVYELTRDIRSMNREHFV